MKPADFDYAAPLSVAEAVSLLADDASAKVLAGGQSLVPLLNFRLAQPSLLVDLRLIPNLDGISEQDDRIVLGAMVSQRQVETSSLLASQCPLLVEAARHIAHPQIRARGTVGGSIAHADPAAETPAALLALEGEVRVVGSQGERRIGAADLYAGVFTTTLAPDEIMLEVIVPKLAPRTGWSLVEIVRRAGDYALVGAAAQVSLSDSGHVSDARLALFGIGDRPIRARGVEEALVGVAASAVSTGAAATHAADGLSPADDIQAPSRYRKHLARVVARRCLNEAIERCRE